MFECLRGVVPTLEGSMSMWANSVTEKHPNSDRGSPATPNTRFSSVGMIGYVVNP